MNIHSYYYLHSLCTDGFVRVCVCVSICYLDGAATLLSLSTFNRTKNVYMLFTEHLI